MWVPSQVVDWFKISKESVEALREEIAVLRAENAGLKSDLLTTKANFSWITTRVNALEIERAQLVEKLYGLKPAVPEIARTAVPNSNFDTDAIFQDMGDDQARKQGFPAYN